MFRIMTAPCNKWLTLFILTLGMMGFISGGPVMAGKPYVQTAHYQTKALYLGSFSHYTEAGQHPSKKAVAFLILETPSMSADAMMPPHLEKGSIAHIELDDSVNISAGTIGDLAYTQTSPAMHPWSQFTYTDFTNQQAMPSNSMKDLFSQKGKHYYYALSNLAREGFDFNAVDVTKHIKEGYDQKNISPVDYAWLLWNDHKIEALKKLAQENDYSKLTYLFHLMESNEHALAHSYLEKNSSSLSNMLALFHNMAAFAGEPVYMEKDDTLFQMSAAFYKNALKVDYIKLCEMSIYANEGDIKKAKQLATSIMKATPDILDSLQTVNRLKPWVGIGTPLFKLPSPAEHVRKDILESLRDDQD